MEARMRNEQQPPDEIWLQWDGDQEPCDDPVSEPDVTWNLEQVWRGDVRYVRADAANGLLAALEKAVECYGQTFGPWNVPNEPGGWLSMAKQAIEKARQ
jgi:hypothetical protein